MTQKIKKEQNKPKESQRKEFTKKKAEWERVREHDNKRKSSDLKKKLINDENLIKRKGKKYIYKKWENETKKRKLKI